MASCYPAPEFRGNSLAWHELAVPAPLPTVWRWCSRRWVTPGISITAERAGELGFSYLRPRPDLGGEQASPITPSARRAERQCLRCQRLFVPEKLGYRMCIPCRRAP